jgi:hypothetical protein
VTPCDASPASAPATVLASVSIDKLPPTNHFLPYPPPPHHRRLHSPLLHHRHHLRHKLRRVGWRVARTRLSLVRRALWSLLAEPERSRVVR